MQLFGILSVQITEQLANESETIKVRSTTQELASVYQALFAIFRQATPAVGKRIFCLLVFYSFAPVGNGGEGERYFRSSSFNQVDSSRHPSLSTELRL